MESRRIVGKTVFAKGEWLVDEQELQDIMDGISDDESDLDPAEIVDIPVDLIADLNEEPPDEEYEEEFEEEISNNNWRHGSFVQQKLPQIQTCSVEALVKHPHLYLEKYFTTEHFSNCAMYTNIYYMQKTGKELKTTALEIQKLYGVFMMMGCFKFPRLSLYWKSGYSFPKISSHISKNRFKLLRSALHYVALDQHDQEDVLWKVNPIINSVRDRCLSINRNIGHYSVDEQIIPFTGRCPIRQYVRNKPRPVGLKNFLITTSSGLVADFLIYKGAATAFSNRSLGLGPGIVLKLVETIPQGSFIYFDRYFTTVPLLAQLLDLGYKATGTIMMNRMKNAKFKCDRSMVRGDFEQLVKFDGSSRIAAVKWKDTKCVVAISTIEGIEPKESVRRWIKKDRKYVNVDSPAAIANYNKFMGGVDICDQLMEYYRTFLKTKKWTLKVAQHMIDLATVNSWMEYRVDCDFLNIPKRKQLKLLDFKLEISETLISTPNRKRRNISDTSSEDESMLPTSTRPSPLPSQGKRFDGYEHWPTWDDLKAPRMCRLESCKSRTRCRCIKCNTYLCSSKENNCFIKFHQNKK